MLEIKIDLIEEQNKLIKYLYSIFTNLEPEIKKQEQEKNNKGSNQLNKEKRIINMEYVYKDMILKFIKESNKLEEGSEQGLKMEEKERLQKAKDEYTVKKKNQVEKLEKRSKHLIDYDEINLDNVYSYGYIKSDKKKAGMLSFVSLIVNF